MVTSIVQTDNGSISTDELIQQNDKGKATCHPYQRAMPEQEVFPAKEHDVHRPAGYGMGLPINPRTGKPIKS